MSELAAQLIDHVIPDVPVRQWVLSLPWTVRYQLAFDAALCSAVLAVFMREGIIRHGAKMIFATSRATDRAEDLRRRPQVLRRRALRDVWAGLRA